MNEVRRDTMRSNETPADWVVHACENRAAKSQPQPVVIMRGWGPTAARDSDFSRWCKTSCENLDFYVKSLGF